MIGDLTADQWAGIIKDVEPSTHAEVALELTERFDVPGDTARDGVDNALDRGVLAEDTSGAFGLLTVADDDDSDTETEQDTEADDDTPDENADSAENDSDVLEAFTTAIEFFNDHLDTELPEVAGYDTPRGYFREGRGWSDQTIADKQLGYAPADENALLDHLMQEGYDRNTILGTGLFYEGGLTPHFQGRYVLPYPDTDGRPCYAISRSLDPDNGGHPADRHGDQKYTKVVKSKDYSAVDEPIYGLETVRDGEPVVITEGIADAITAHQAGMPCLSPVTTQFKDQHHDPVLDVLDAHNVPRAYLIQDSEAPSSSLRQLGDDETADSITDAVTIEQYGSGVKGAVKTAAFLADNDVDARIGELPRPGSEKVDLDDYLQVWGDDALAPVAASAKPMTDHPAHDPKELAKERADQIRKEFGEMSGSSDGTRSALFDLDVFDVAGISTDYRGKNPLGHHGDSAKYCTPISSDGPLYDHKYKVAYNGITYLLCEAGERRADDPNGRLDDSEVLAAWVHAKQQGYISSDDPIPHRALRHVAVSEGLCTTDEIEDGWKLPIEARNDALDVIRDRYGVDPGREPLQSDSGNGAARFYETCKPPLTTDADPIDIDARRDTMTGELYDEFAGRDDVTIWAHNPGEGKTTSAAIAAAERDRDHVVLLPKHENCREFQTDDKKPDGYFHLKGAAQPRDDHCMDAELAGEDCDRHIGDCPTMCPVYSELGSDHPTRQAFDALAGTVGVRKAHQILELSEREWHDDKCAWLQQWDHVDSADRIVTVHDYAPLKSVRNQGDVIIDDLQGSLIEETDVGLNALSRCQQALRNFSKHADTDRTTVTMQKLAEFVDDLVMVLSDADADSATFADVDVPNFPDGYVRTFDNPDKIPDDVPADEIEETTQREYVGEGGQYTKERAFQATVTDLAEPLAQAKRAYNDILLSRMRDGRWSDTPFCLDTVFAALAAAGGDGRECRVAAATPDYLSQCSRCDSRLAPNDGRLMCTEGGCGWTEGEDPLTAADDSPVRIDAEPRTGETTVHGITTRRLPAADELPHPSNVLVLDATPRKAVTAGLFGVGEDQVTIDGNDAYSLPNATVTQIADGAYHRSTLTDSLTARQRVQSAIERINDMHDDVIYIALQKAIDLFEWPDGAEVMNYYALRGLDRPEADAVVCVGAPHPDENAMRADAQVLSQDNPRIRSGGTELSTRNESELPIYRKLNYTDADGNGRAVASKTYTGLTGDLFDAAHADEIEQAAHRNRPILATENDERHVYLLTNVATNLPIDRLTGFDAFLNPTEHHLDVRDSALDLLDAMAETRDDETADDYAADGGVISLGATVTEWHETAEDAGMDVSRSTISRALGDLRDCGLVKEGRYAQRRGRLQTLTELGARVAARKR